MWLLGFFHMICGDVIKLIHDVMFQSFFYIALKNIRYKFKNKCYLNKKLCPNGSLSLHKCVYKSQKVLLLLIVHVPFVV